MHVPGHVLVTGAAGFIGAAVAEALLRRGDRVTGVDDLNPYYDPALKRARLARLSDMRVHEIDVADDGGMDRLFAAERFDAVVHLAAQAGVRHSLENPRLYVRSNVSGFLNVLEGARDQKVRHLVYASSSSVYGDAGAGEDGRPFSTADPVDHPVSLYAATKRANELMAHSYAHLYAVPMTGLRFFTVFGPWGRPDMAPMVFLDRLLRDEPLRVFNEGRHARDFTYVDDVVDAVLRVLDRPPVSNPNGADDRPDGGRAPARVYNVGRGRPTALLDFIAMLGEAAGREPRLDLVPMQPGDVERTAADTSALERDTGFRPRTDTREGVGRFVRWYRDFYRV